MGNTKNENTAERWGPHPIFLWFACVKFHSHFVFSAILTCLCDRLTLLSFIGLNYCTENMKYNLFVSNSVSNHRQRLWMSGQITPKGTYYHFSHTMCENFPWVFSWWFLIAYHRQEIFSYIPLWTLPVTVSF